MFSGALGHQGWDTPAPLASQVSSQPHVARVVCMRTTLPQDICTFTHEFSHHGEDLRGARSNTPNHQKKSPPPFLVSHRENTALVLALPMEYSSNLRSSCKYKQRQRRTTPDLTPKGKRDSQITVFLNRNFLCHQRES